jgi:hypothetical protein
MAEKHPCAEDVPDGGRMVGFHRCTRSGTVQEDGQWWCRQHAPSAVKARRDEREAAYRAKRNAARSADQRAAALAARAGCKIYNVRGWRDAVTPTELGR